ncbi:Abi-alpha family protein [Bradyrhizobium sp. 18BD]
MTENAPYEGAIEEAAKTVGKGLDLIKQSSQHIADIYGILIGDQLHAARHRRLDAITRRTKQILKDRDAQTTEIPEQIAIPLLESAQSESRKEMQELWARLLANAMDADRAADVRPEFILVLKALQPLDALVLQTLRNKVKDPTNTNIQAPQLVGGDLDVRESLVSLSLDSLATLRCLKEVGNSNGQTIYRFTSFGIEFLHACRP